MRSASEWRLAAGRKGETPMRSRGIEISWMLSVLFGTTIYPLTGAQAQCPACAGAASPVCPLSWEKGFQATPTLVTGCVASVVANWDQGNSESCNASVPQGTVLIDIRPNEDSTHNGSYSVSRYTAGHLNYSQSVNDSYSSLYSLALQIDSNYAAEIKKAWDRHRLIAEAYDSNSDSARVNVSAQGSGNWYDQWRG
jgi:hypothetical protein